MNNPFDFFDKIYCINLAERTDRWEECLKNFEKYDIKNYERIDGIKINGDLPQKRKGQIGCSLAFLSCFLKAKNDQHNKVLVLEDDFEFIFEKNELFNKLEKCLNELPDDWDSIFLGANLTAEHSLYPIKKFSQNLFELKSAHCLHCAGFSRAGISKIFDFLGEEEDPNVHLLMNYENMDVFMAKIYQSSTKSFITNELLCNQKPSLSNIEGVAYDYNEWMHKNFKFFKNNLI